MYLMNIYLYFSSGSALRKMTWSHETGNFVENPLADWTVYTHCWTSQNRVLAATGDHALACYDPTNGVVHLIPLPDAVHSNDNVEALVTLGDEVLTHGRDGVIRVLRLAAEQPTLTVTATIDVAAFRERVPAHVVPSHSRGSFVVTSNKGYMYFLDRATGEAEKVCQNED
jgi:hypothetical protein